MAGPSARGAAGQRTRLCTCFFLPSVPSCSSFYSPYFIARVSFLAALHILSIPPLFSPPSSRCLPPGPLAAPPPTQPNPWQVQQLERQLGARDEELDASRSSVRLTPLLPQRSSCPPHLLPLLPPLLLVPPHRMLGRSIGLRGSWSAHEALYAPLPPVRTLTPISSRRSPPAMRSYHRTLYAWQVHGLEGHLGERNERLRESALELAASRGSVRDGPPAVIPPAATVVLLPPLDALRR